MFMEYIAQTKYVYLWSLQVLILVNRNQIYTYNL